MIEAVDSTVPRSVVAPEPQGPPAARRRRRRRPKRNWWQRRFDSAGRLVRWNDWSSSKVGPLLAVFFYAALLANLAPLEVLGSFAAILAFVCLCAAFGYAANDFADRQADQLAGKANAIGRLPRFRAAALLVGLGLGGLAALWPFYGRPYLLELALLTYAAGAGYSLRPVRFKERGGLGLLVGAAAQRPLPALVIFAALGALRWEAWLVAALLLLVGLRGMLEHQLRDRENDLRAGVQTYVTAIGDARARWQFGRLVKPAEGLCLVAVVVSMALRWPVLWLLLVAYVAWLGWPNTGRTSKTAVLPEFYRVYWPLSLAAVLAAREPALAPLPVVVVLWQRQFLKRRLGDLARTLRATFSSS